MAEDSDDFETRCYPPYLPEDRADIEAFLKERGLGWFGEPDYTLALFRGGAMVGAGSLSGRVLWGLAVEEGLRGRGLAARILSGLEAEAARRGDTRPFVYTTPDKLGIFEAMGYRLVGEAPGAALLLEKGDGVERWAADLRSMAAVAVGGRRPPLEGRVAALVMNCNPFTLGHLHLVRTAAAASSLVFLFVVSEEASSFPFEIRLRLVREGIAGISNVIVIPGGDYIVSRATFPTYFLKDRVGEAAAIQARLDADVFGRHIAPAVGALRRFVGEEPLSGVTALYNRIMKEALPSYGVEVVEIPRAERGGEPVSASKVRALIRAGRLGDAKDLVPPSTWNFLVSHEAAPVLAKIASSDERH